MIYICIRFGRLTQLVQSASLTRRKSGVRVPHCPQYLNPLCYEGFFIWVINSVGLECYLDRVEVTGSNPVWPTKNKPALWVGFIIIDYFLNLTFLTPWFVSHWFCSSKPRLIYNFIAGWLSTPVSTVKMIDLYVFNTNSTNFLPIPCLKYLG